MTQTKDPSPPVQQASTTVTPGQSSGSGGSGAALRKRAGTLDYDAGAKLLSPANGTVQLKQTGKKPTTGEKVSDTLGNVDASAGLAESFLQALSKLGIARKLNVAQQAKLEKALGRMGGVAKVLSIAATIAAVVTAKSTGARVKATVGGLLGLASAPLALVDAFWVVLGLVAPGTMDGASMQAVRLLLNPTGSIKIGADVLYTIVDVWIGKGGSSLKKLDRLVGRMGADFPQLVKNSTDVGDLVWDLMNGKERGKMQQDTKQELGTYGNMYHDTKFHAFLAKLRGLEGPAAAKKAVFDAYTKRLQGAATLAWPALVGTYTAYLSQKS